MCLLTLLQSFFSAPFHDFCLKNDCMHALHATHGHRYTLVSISMVLPSTVFLAEFRTELFLCRDFEAAQTSPESGDISAYQRLSNRRQLSFLFLIPSQVEIGLNLT